MAHDENKILTLKEVAQELRLDPRTVKEVAFALGGRRIGYRWRFRWGTVLEYKRSSLCLRRQAHWIPLEVSMGHGVGVFQQCRR